jgi:2-polyprenyl-3-methyl-5-hydroxy-6-metoxy-1,4-benzoquinol methylase
MSNCPACARPTVVVGPASRATGRQIHRCRSCGARFWPDHGNESRQQAITVQNAMSADDYSDWVDIKREQAGPEAWRAATGWMLEVLDTGARPPDLYDVGAGDGQYLSIARDEFGFRVTGNEVVSGAVALAKSRYGVDLDLGVLGDLDHRDDADAVTLWCVLAHVDDGDALLTEVRTMLRPGGVLFLQTPHWTGADTTAHAVKRLTAGRVSKVPDRRIAQHHWILHTRRSITAQLERLGYVDVVAEPKVRYTLTSRAYLMSMNLPSWTVPPAAWLLDKAVSSRLAPRIVLDVRARKPRAGV